VSAGCPGGSLAHPLFLLILSTAGSVTNPGTERHRLAGRESAGLLGLPQLVIGNNFRETGELELETRDGETSYITRGDVPDLFA